MQQVQINLPAYLLDRIYNDNQPVRYTTRPRKKVKNGTTRKNDKALGNGERPEYRGIPVSV